MDDVVDVLFVLGWGEVSIGELLSIEEHLDDPQEFVADVAA